MKHYLSIITDGMWKNNPILHQVLGVCSALAVTTGLKNALVMTIAVLFVSAFSNVMVSSIKNLIPHRIRLIIEMIIIATFVILFDIFLKAYYYSMSLNLGPYVALIITNCIILGRTEAFALKNNVVDSFFDGIGNGLGYGFILLFVAFFRELLGNGTLFGFAVMPSGFKPAQAILLAPGAFLIMGILVWGIRFIQLQGENK